MECSPTEPRTPTTPVQTVRAIGCVGYLNAKPLIEGLDALSPTQVRLDVPSRLASQLESGEVDLSLCPVIDYFRSTTPLQIVPVGGIGCLGPTLTVRLYSKLPYEQITRVHTDRDSHTSVALLRVILSERYHASPEVVPLDTDGPITWPDHPRGKVDAARTPTPQAVLLIGDKVVTNHPPQGVYAHELDLGEAWHDLTGLPFVFAVWMARQGTDLGNLPATLRDLRITNAKRIKSIAMRYAPQLGWPPDLADRYLQHHMRYEIGRPQLDAIERFGAMAYTLGLIDRPGPLCVYGEA
jgi:chorismate dehydratase